MARLDSSGTLRRVSFAPIELRGGTRLTLISPEQWIPLAEDLSKALRDAHDEWTRLLGPLPPFETSLRLMDEDSFFALTGAPRWTNAMYFRGQIIIPLVPEELADSDNLRRSVRHEYTHALLNALSGGRCPGWLDEGLAQWIEGTPNPQLGAALRTWLNGHEPVPFKLLQGGFTKLETGMVAAAYAQSLYASQSVISNFGFSRVRTYLDALRDGAERPDAFATGFSLSEDVFERRFGTLLTRWAHRGVRKLAGYSPSSEDASSAAVITN